MKFNREWFVTAVEILLILTVFVMLSYVFVRVFYPRLELLIFSGIQLSIFHGKGLFSQTTYKLKPADRLELREKRDSLTMNLFKSIVRITLVVEFVLIVLWEVFRGL